jgi:MFS family permease
VTKSRLWTRSFVIISLENFLVALSFWLLLTVIAKFATDQFGASTAVAGFSASIFIIGAIVGRPLCGRWIHRVGQTRMIYLGASLNLMLTLLYLVVGNIALLLLIRIIHGAVFGATHVAAGTIVAEVVPRERYGEGIGYFTLGQTLATAIGPFVGLPLIQSGNFTYIALACSVAAVIGLVILPLLSVKNLELTEEQLTETRGFRLSNYIERSTIPIALVALVLYFCYSNLISFLALYAQEISLTGPASFFFLVCAIAMLLTRPLVGRQFDAKGENAVMYPALPLFALGLAVFSQARYGWMLLLAAVIVGLGFGAVQTSGQAIAVKIAPPHRRGLATSTFYTFADVGAGIGPLLCGLIIPFIGYRGTYLGVAAAAAASSVLYYAVYGRSAGNKPTS